MSLTVNLLTIINMLDENNYSRHPTPPHIDLVTDMPTFQKLHVTAIRLLTASIICLNNTILDKPTHKRRNDIKERFSAS